VPDERLCELVLAENARPGPGKVRRVRLLDARQRRKRLAAQREWVRRAPVRAAHGQRIARRDPPIAARQVPVLLRRTRSRIADPAELRRLREDRRRVVLVLVREEIVEPILDDRPPDREASLLIGVRQY